MISVFQIYFDEKSSKYLDKDFYPYKNEYKDGFFENTIIADLYKMSDSLKQGMKYLGVSSWKMNEKTNLTGREILDYIQKDIDAGTEKDVYIYSPIQGLEFDYDFSKKPYKMHGTIKGPDIWHMHKQWGIHPYDADVLLNEAKILPFDLFDGKWAYCHCNYFIAKKHVFDEYCKTTLIPFMNFFKQKEKENHPACEKWYLHRHEEIKYPSYSFVAEGLFGAFLAHTNYSYDYLCKKKKDCKMHWVKIDGFEIVND